jgi:hypothetical protein
MAKAGDWYELDLTTKSWTALAQAPELALDGTAPAPVHLNRTSVLLRFDGSALPIFEIWLYVVDALIIPQVFREMNLTGLSDIYDVRADAWRTVASVPDSRFGSPA